MQFKFHTEGWTYIVSVLILIIIIIPFFNILGIFLIILLIFILFFFRDPNRCVPNDNFIISPADGLISYVGESKLPIDASDTKIPYNRISIFLSIFDVHVNRMPISGKIKKINYHDGKFINASYDKSSEENERNVISIEHDNQIFYVVQIAGLIARRIVCQVDVNQELNKGDRIGIIKFGSRVDLYLPKEYNILVSKGQKVIAGETIISNPELLNKITNTIIK